MKGVFNIVAGYSLCVGISLAQNYAAEYNRICANSPQSEVEISDGFYATYHCGEMPYQNSWISRLPANTPEDCVKACAALPGCQVTSWGTVHDGTEGCHAFRGIKTFSKPGYAYITYRQDCQKEIQPTIDGLNKDLQHHQALLGQCVKDKATSDSNLATCIKDKGTTNSKLATCEADLKKCQNGSDGGSDGGSDIIPSSCKC